jgi:hypothetical protein
MFSAWHGRMKKKLGDAAPSIHKTINVLKDEQLSKQVIIDQMLAGEDPPLPQKKYRTRNRRIRNVVEDYANRNRLEYLRAISYNFDY